MDVVFPRTYNLGRHKSRMRGHVIRRFDVFTLANDRILNQKGQLREAVFVGDSDWCVDPVRPYRADRQLAAVLRSRGFVGKRQERIFRQCDVIDSVRLSILKCNSDEIRGDHGLGGSSRRRSSLHVAFRFGDKVFDLAEAERVAGIAGRNRVGGRFSSVRRLQVVIS